MDFFAKKHGMDCGREFRAVLEGVAREFGIHLPNGNGRTRPKEPPKHIRTLAERGISERTAQAFRVREEAGDHQVTHKIIFPVTGPDGQVIGEKTHKTGNVKAGPIQLYPWGVLKKDGLIYLVNGEPSVWRAYEAGYRNVLCCTGGEQNFKPEWADLFHGRSARIAYDHDETGRKGMEKVAGILHGKVASVEVVVWPEGTPEKHDAEDWLNAGHKLEELTFRMWEPVPKIVTVASPQRRVDFPLELPDSVWRGVVRDYRDMLARTTEASDAFHLFTFKTCIGSAIGRRAYVRYGLPLYGNLYACLVGKTAESRKSTSLRHGERTAREADPSWRVLHGLSSAEGLLSQLADPWEKKGRKGEVVAEGGTTDKRLLVWLGELSSLLKKARQDSVSNLLPILAEAYDSPPSLSLPTKLDPITASEPHISLLAASTPAWLEDLQDRDIMAGFANRFAFILGEPKPPIAWPSPPDAGLYAKVIAHISDVLLWLPDSLEVTMTGSARDLWSEFYVRWKSQVWPDEMFGALVQRIPDITLKIALIYAVLEKRTQIAPDILTAAIDAGGYCVASTQRIFTDFHATRESKLEGRILEVLKAGPVKFGDLHRAVGGRYSTLELNRALDALVKSGQIWRQEQGGTVIYGLSTEE
ncbi:MAG: hypothetical protein A3F84_12845 [Candidatus Handelsmanbacteria bacterium RIFCSPLOWO2_12_FULL_64_10]|uniref:Toprim domain-containing protein n=1 Tax=Handelsmanbacteria sp. (strain RIFCSPLOWO2_12_FULL_64_10) TaxID=1817868 RepID=A0A1F6CF04_HANXR|nr:MAG: hypothetical protein A3F84_12845 [Candidatus Handelsmanbacteria bacterium RIFCSPLOWO2_12_FULL_64_10]